MRAYVRADMHSGVRSACTKASIWFENWGCRGPRNSSDGDI